MRTYGSASTKWSRYAICFGQDFPEEEVWSWGLSGYMMFYVTLNVIHASALASPADSSFVFAAEPCNIK